MTDTASAPAFFPEPDPSGPVTIVISRRVIPGKESEFEELSTEMTRSASRFPGYLGANMFRPATKDDPEYRIIFRFSSPDMLKAWHQSSEREVLLGRIEQLLSSPTRREISYGIAGWFDLPIKQAVPPPPKYKMTIVSWMALYPIVTLIFLIFGPVLEYFPLPIRTLLVTAVVMVLMSYVAMPRMTRWFHGWLFRR